MMLGVEYCRFGWLGKDDGKKVGIPLTCPPLWNRSLSKGCRIDIFSWYPLVN